MKKSLGDEKPDVSQVKISSNTPNKSAMSILSPNMVLLTVFPAIAMGVIAFAVTVWEQHSVDTLLNEPVDLPLTTERWSGYRKNLWNNYQPNVYIGMQPNTQSPLTVGLAWFVQNEGDIRLHHKCVAGGSPCLSSKWSRHDGISFGQQILTSSEGFIVRSEFITASQSSSDLTWTLRVTVDPLKKMQSSFISLIVYIHNEGEGQMDLNGNMDKGMVEEIFGHTPEIKEFRLYFPYKFLTKTTAYSYLRTSLPPGGNITNHLLDSLDKKLTFDKWAPLYTLTNPARTDNRRINFIAYQINSLLLVPIEMDIVFESGLYSAAWSISGKRFTDLSVIKQTNFDRRFEEVFKLLSKGFNVDYINLCKSALSNLLGSIKYTYNTSIKVVKGESLPPADYFSSPVLASLSTSQDGVPEFSLINEGFHQLLVLQWNTNLTKSVIAHWLDTMNAEGWIPGVWPVGGAPDGDSVTVLDTSHATAPSLFLSLESLLDQMERLKEMDYEYLKEIYPRLEVWFDWMNVTQAGPSPGTFKWNGRDSDQLVWNPETPMSGMGDFPRSSDPSHPGEYHLDLRCWMALGSRVLARTAELIGERSTDYYAGTYQDLTEPRGLDQLHWNKKSKTYSDYGYSDPSVKLVRSKSGEYVKKGTGKHSLRFIDSFGYVSLFPVMLMLLSPDSPKLGYTLKQLQNPSLLWSKYGVRSLSKNDQLYHKSNHPGARGLYVWRGPVHIHINYLLMRALHHYQHSPGPYSEIAGNTYNELRRNIINVVTEEYSRTKSLWAYYDDKTGFGKGERNSGLSSLILLIMAEIY